MELVEIPIVDDLEPNTAWSDRPPVKFEEQEMDIAAFALWRRASLPEAAAEDEAR